MGRCYYYTELSGGTISVNVRQKLSEIIVPEDGYYLLSACCAVVSSAYGSIQIMINDTLWWDLFYEIGTTRPMYIFPRQFQKNDVLSLVSNNKASSIEVYTPQITLVRL